MVVHDKTRLIGWLSTKNNTVGVIFGYGSFLTSEIIHYWHVI